MLKNNILYDILICYIFIELLSKRNDKNSIIKHMHARAYKHTHTHEISLFT